MAYAMWGAKLGDRPRFDLIKCTAREVRNEIAQLFPADNNGEPHGWKAAKKAGWRVVHVWVGYERN